MKFKTIAEAFNYYRTKTAEEMETRAKEIGHIIDTDEKADIATLNIELSGIKEARENLETRSSAAATLNIITGMSAESQKGKTFGDDVLDTPEYRSAFYKNLLGQGMTEPERAAFDAGIKIAEKRADAFTSSTDAVAVLPTQTLNEIIKKARTQGGLLAECRSFSLPTKISVPVGTPSDKAAWHTEGAEVDGEKVTPTAIAFDGYEIIKVFSISAKTRRMSIAAFESYLVEELTACVMETINDALVNGTGSGQGTGLLTGITWKEGENMVQTAKTKNFTYTDVVKTVALLKRGYSNGAKWAMNNATLYTEFYGMVDSTGRPIFIADPKAESIGKILGHEVVIDDNFPDNAATLGNYSQYMGYNMPEGIAIEVSRESSFRKGLIDYRALAIADCKPIVPEAFVKLCKAAE